MFSCWRRLDEPGLEVFQLTPTASGFLATSVLVHAGKELRYRWTLDAHWRTSSVRLDLATRSVQIERTGDTTWRVDGQPLNGCDELDLSATPFCNALAIRRMGGKSGELTAAYIDAATLSVTPSRQRYELIAENRWRYVDLGVAKGFEATLDLDADGLVTHYEGLFELIHF